MAHSPKRIHNFRRQKALVPGVETVVEQHFVGMPVAVVVIGGSVGGVSTAVALQKAGCEVVVLERAAAIVATTGAVSAPVHVTADA